LARLGRLRGRLVTTAAAAACVAAGLLSCAGCSSGAGSAALTRGSSPSQSLPTRALPSPGCSDQTAGRPRLPGVRVAMTAVRDGPFGMALTSDGRWGFVAVGAGVEVLRFDRSLVPVPVRTIPLPGSPGGEAITPDGRYLLVADGAGAAVLSVARAEAGTPGAVLGTLSAAAAARAGHGPATPRQGQAAALLETAVEVAVSPDGRFAFVSLEYASQVAVFNLARALADGFGAADDVGRIPLGESVAGLAVSPDGRWLYATSEVSSPAQHLAGPAGPTALSARQAAGCPGTYPGEGPGTLTVISLGRAETDPAGSVTATVDAGFQPVRVVTSAGGALVWVTARASDDLLCFSAARLAASPARALLAVVRVGAAPVGLAAVRGGSLIVVADSDRFGSRGATPDLDVVSVADALAGRGAAVLGRVPSGLFPRDMAAPSGGDGLLLVSNNASNQVEAVDLAGLPRG